MAAGVKQRLSLIRVFPKTDCWEFKGARDVYGHGRIYSENKELKAHRFFYEQCESPIAPGAYPQHYFSPEKCIGHACCNPVHLRISDSPKAASPLQVKRCPKGHVMTSENRVIEKRKGHLRPGFENLGVELKDGTDHSSCVRDSSPDRLR